MDSTGMTHMWWMMDIFRGQIDQGCFFVHQYSGKSSRKAEFGAMESILVSQVDSWRSFVTNYTITSPS